MKIFLRILLASLFIFLGFKLLLPFHLYPIEHFEYKLLRIFPISWKFAAFLSRILIGLLFVFAFLLLFYFPKIKWIKWFSPLFLAVPFIINTILLENLEDKSLDYSEEIPFEFNHKSEQPVLVAYLSANCIHCREAVLKLKTAKEINKNFPEVIAISYNNKLDSFFMLNKVSYPLEVIDLETFVDITKSSFPKFQLIKNNRIIKKWEPTELNFEVMDKLSNQKF